MNNCLIFWYTEYIGWYLIDVFRLHKTFYPLIGPIPASCTEILLSSPIHSQWIVVYNLGLSERFLTTLDYMIFFFTRSGRDGAHMMLSSSLLY